MEICTNCKIGGIWRISAIYGTKALKRDLGAAHNIMTAKSHVKSKIYSSVSTVLFNCVFLLAIVLVIFYSEDVVT